MTTRECPDFNLLMEKRIKTLKKHNLKLYELIKIVKAIEPLREGKNF
jgi:hypothetical protein